MSDDKNKTDPPKGDGTGPATTDAGTGNATAIPFGELMGHIDSRISALLGKQSKGNDGNATGGTAPAGTPDPQGIREQLRAELAKLQGEEAAKQKEADRDVTIAELKEQITKITEGAPVQEVSKLTQIMWGKRTKKS